ncbi:MAG: pyridoxine 5'-phosphate synthase [Candidatus Omnitrophota bacterium]
MMKLGVNIDHVATVRQARGGAVPDPLAAAGECERAGCDSIVCHLREDRRHINDNDLIRLKKTLTKKLNLEMSCARGIVAIALKIVPDQATLVPERRAEITTEGGLDVITHYQRIKEVTAALATARIPVSLFIDPERQQIEAARSLGANCVELHTGKYANASTARQMQKELLMLKDSARFATQCGLKVFAGHGLDYENVIRIAAIPEVEELNIGHSIISHALFVGLEKAVREMLGLISGLAPKRGRALRKGGKR